MSETEIVRNRYDFVYLFDCQDGNPNGDPDLTTRPASTPRPFRASCPMSVLNGRSATT